MRNNIDKLVSILEKDSTGVDTIFSNLQQLDYVLNKIVYLKSHAINMMFKDAVVLKKEAPDEYTVVRGLSLLKNMLHDAINMVIKE